MSLNKLILILLIATISLLLSSPLYGVDWKSINTGNNFQINGIYFLNEKIGFAVSKNGNLIKLKETPHTWKVTINKYDCAFEDICFLEDGSRGFAFGGNGYVYTTEDTGRTWIKSGLGNGFRFFDMCFTDSVNGFLVGANFRVKRGDNGVAFQTKDGGLTWDSLGINGWQLKNIDNSDGRTMTITGKRKVVYTQDNGLNWSSINVAPQIAPTAVTFQNDYGMMIGMGGYFARTDDAGKTWNRIENIPRTLSMYDVLMIDSLQAYIIGSGGVILYTDDGGFNFIPEVCNSSSDLFDIHRCNKRVFICGKRGAIIYGDMEK